MELISKIKELNSNIEKIEQLADDLLDGLDSKEKKINHLRKQIEKNINQIDEIIEDYNANS